MYTNCPYSLRSKLTSCNDHDVRHMNKALFHEHHFSDVPWSVCCVCLTVYMDMWVTLSGDSYQVALYGRVGLEHNPSMYLQMTFITEDISKSCEIDANLVRLH